MRVKSSVMSQVWLILILFLVAGLATACDFAEPEAEAGIHTWLLVRAPDGPIPVGRQLIVKSRSEAPAPGISHVELYLVELRSSDTNDLILDNLLIRSDAAPFNQTTFTAEQPFIPEIPGHYVIKVVGYDKSGATSESEYIGFDVEFPAVE